MMEVEISTGHRINVFDPKINNIAIYSLIYKIKIQ